MRMFVLVQRTHRWDNGMRPATDTILRASRAECEAMMASCVAAGQKGLSIKPSPLTALEVRQDEKIAAQIWAEIDAGIHDTRDGHAPDAVFLNDDGWSVSYAPIVEGGIRWEHAWPRMTADTLDPCGDH